MKYKYYRNGKPARVLIEDRPDTLFCILSIDMSTGVIYYHIKGGHNNLNKFESQWDLFEENPLTD